jgi:hypothetical protein
VGELADYPQERVWALERAEDDLVIGDRGVLIISDQNENRQVLLSGTGCSQNGGSFRGVSGVAQDEQIERVSGEDRVSRVDSAADAHIEARPSEEQLTCHQKEGVTAVDKNLTRHTTQGLYQKNLRAKTALI